MDLPTQNHLTTLRHALVFRLEELRDEVSAAAARRRAESRAAEPSDFKEAAERMEAAELDQASEQRDLDELSDVEAALRRLDAGVYGDCLDCGEPIGMARLMAMPAARRCAACQQALEHSSA